MRDTLSNPPPGGAAEGPRVSKTRRCVLAGGSGAALLMILYFVLTSSVFLRTVVIPRIGNALNAKLSVGDLSLSPFSQVILKQVRLETTGATPLLQAEEARVRYRLFSILRGDLKIEDITLRSPKLELVVLPDGTSNLDPLLQRKTTNALPSSSETKPLKLDLQNLVLSGGVVNFTRLGKDGSRQASEVANLQVNLDHVGNGQAGRLRLAADLTHGNYPARSGTNQTDLVGAKLTGAFDFALDAVLRPTTLKGDLRLDLAQGRGRFEELAGLGVTLVADTSATEIRQAALRFDKAGQRLGQLQLSGPFDLVKQEARLRIDVSAIDRTVLNLFGAARGLDFGNTTLNGTSQLDVARHGEALAASGHVTVGQFGIRQAQLISPVLDLDLDYRLSANLTDRTGMIQKLALTAKQRQSDLLNLTLDRPLNLSWGENVHGLTEATLSLVLHELNLADWRMFLGTNLTAGKVSAQCKIISQQDGRQLGVDLKSEIRDLAASAGSNRLEQARISLQLQSQVDDFNALHADRFVLEASQHDRPLFNATGSLGYNLATRDSRLQLTLESDLANLLREFPVPGLEARSGGCNLNAFYAVSKGVQTAKATLTLKNLSGRFSTCQFQDLQVTTEGDLELNGSKLEVRRATVSLQNRAAAGGTLDLGGRCDLSAQTGELTFNVANLNPNGLQPFLASALAPRTLVSGTLNAKGNAHYEAQGRSTLQTQATLTQFALADADHKPPGTPIDVQLELECSQDGLKTEVRRLVLGLPPTLRATNQLQLQGLLDLAPTNPAPSSLRLTSEGVDLTPLYDLFATNPPPATTNLTPKTAPGRQPAVADTEPPPVKLPVQEFNAEVKIARAYLREMAITNLNATARIKRGELAVNPLQLVLNGAPVTASAKLDLNQPGFVYDLDVRAERIPLEPLANTFTPEKRGQFQGDIYLDAQIKGAGVTGGNLQKSLSGRASFSLTNMNLQAVGPKTKRLLTPIALLLRVDELLESPLNLIAVSAVLGHGTIDVQQFVAASPAFYASSQGTIQLATILTNSPIHFPVQLALRRSLANKIKFVSGTPLPNTNYVQLPQFVKVGGTLGDPATETDKAKVAGVLASGVASAIGGRAGETVQGIGNLLQGENPLSPSTLTNLLPKPRADNRTNAPPKVNPFDLLRDLVPKK